MNDDPRALRDAIAESLREIEGPPPDEIDCALRTLTEARRILKDTQLMAAVRLRLDEQRDAVAAASKGSK